ncbi:hypothetical protein FQR65_LT16227 [Abscondita terminalis]|nr:hypothetical protein FQR65_LT16227 [Abscondita terminalis]
MCRNAAFDNQNRSSNKYKFENPLKQFGAYLLIIGSPLLYETLSVNMKSVLPSISTIRHASELAVSLGMTNKHNLNNQTSLFTSKDDHNDNETEKELDSDDEANNVLVDSNIISTEDTEPNGYLCQETSSSESEDDLCTISENLITGGDLNLRDFSCKNDDLEYERGPFVKVRTQNGNVALEELRTVFTSELACTVYISFLKQISLNSLELALKNHVLIRSLCREYEQEIKLTYPNTLPTLQL